jgi:hypothetical protein
MTARTPELQRLAAARPTLASQTSILVGSEERQRLLDTITADPSRVRPPGRYLHLFKAPLGALSGATGSSPSRARTRLRTMVGRHTRISVAVSLLALIAASGAIADAAGVVTLPAFWQQEPAAPSPYGTASSIPTNLASSFAILRRPRQPAIDALPAAGAAEITAGPGGQHYGVNPALSRFAGTVDGVSFWLVPGGLGSCMYTSTDGDVCTSNALMSTHGAQALLVPVAGGADTFIGIVPDGATITATNGDGSGFSVALNIAAYTISDHPNLRSVTVHEPDGQQYTNDIPAPTTPAPGPANGTAPPSTNAPVAP